MKKILITNSTCLQDNIGGASRSIDEIALELSKFCDITLIVPNRNNKKDIEKINENYKIIRYTYNPKNKFTKLISSIKFFIKNRLIFDNRYDVVWGQSPEPFLYLMIFTRLRKIKNIIYTFHGPWYEEYKYASGRENILLKYIIKFIEKIILYYSNTIHFQSNYIFNKIKNDHNIEKNIKILNILINPEQYKNKRYLPTNIIKKDKLNLFLIRRLTPRTGVLNFVKNVNLLDENIKSEINILIAGQGEEFNLIQNYIIENKMSNCIKILGEIEQNLADSLIYNSNYIVMPSIGAEGFGVTVLEALYQETEVLYANNGGMKEFLEEIYPDNMFNPIDFLSLEKLLKDKITLHKQNNFKKKFRQVNSNLDFKKNLKNLLGIDYEKKDN
ncbi:glycosyltransferase [Aliarcobacter cryaerophilus]|uniref:glycosyltransferase n=1 Tax=Aliarcobacter cryaerophilus TaxID=28198 RepID=UPI003DA62EE3